MKGAKVRVCLYNNLVPNELTLPGKFLMEYTRVETNHKISTSNVQILLIILGCAFMLRNPDICNTTSKNQNVEVNCPPYTMTKRKHP